MYKAKLFGFAAACMIGISSINPITVLAADTNSAAVTAPEKDSNQKNNRAAFEDAMKKANEKWNALSRQQKDQVYVLVENEIKAEMQLMDKLVELGVMEKNDVAAFKSHMQDRFNKLKASGQFPFVKQRSPKSSK
jgi:ribosomal protein S20